MVAYEALGYEARRDAERAPAAAWQPRPHTVIAVFGAQASAVAASALARGLATEASVRVVSVASLRTEQRTSTAPPVWRLAGRLFDDAALADALAAEPDGVAVVARSGRDRAVARLLAALEDARFVYRAGSWTDELIVPRGA